MTWNELKETMDEKLTDKQKDVPICKMELSITDFKEHEPRYNLEVDLWC